MFYTCLSFCPQWGCVYPSMHRGRHPPRQTLPWADTPPGQTPPGQTSPWADPLQTPTGRLPSRQTHTRWADTPWADPPPADGYCSRRYASYWNAFLCENRIDTVISRIRLLSEFINLTSKDIFSNVFLDTISWVYIIAG